LIGEVCYFVVVVNWQVTLGEPIEIPGLKAEDFETGSTGMLSRYTSGMRQVKRAYKRQYGMEKNTLYLFFMDFPEIDKNGFMLCVHCF